MNWKRYTNVLRNMVFLVAVGFARSALQLKEERRKAENAGINMHVLIMIGGIGDIVAADPAVRAVTARDEHVVMLARSTYMSLFEFHPSIKATLRVEAYIQALILKRIFSRARWTNLHVDGHRCNMFRVKVRNPNAAGISVDNYYDGRTLTDVYSAVAVGRCLAGRPQVYCDPSFDVQRFLAQNFVSPRAPLLVIHTQATESIRSWPGEECCKAISQLVARLEINVLELGLDPVLQITPGVVQPRNTLTLSQQVAVMKRCTVFLGVDSGFAHIANALSLPSVLLLGYYKGFEDYLPWKCGPSDIILRSRGEMRDLNFSDVATSVALLMGQCHTKKDELTGAG